jgi:hypothetical protein
MQDRESGDGNPSAGSHSTHGPQRRRSVPIADEHRLVVPDALATTIKTTSLGCLAMSARMTPAGYRRRDRCRGLYTDCRRAVLRGLLLPSRASSQRTGSLWVQPADNWMPGYALSARQGPMGADTRAERRIGAKISSYPPGGTGRTEYPDLRRALMRKHLMGCLTPWQPSCCPAAVTAPRVQVGPPQATRRR